MPAWAALGSTFLTTLMLVGCYNPHVTPGKLRCTQDTERKCPEGFFCGDDGTCWSTSPGSTGGRGSGGSGGSGGHGGQGGQGGQSNGCATRAPLCTSGEVSGCDPVCQTGSCDCSKKCGVVTTGTGTTEAACVPTGTVKEGAACNLASDDCEPGLVCQAESCGTGVARCYRLCRDASACGGTPCTRSVVTASGTATAFLHCNAPATPCDPIAQTGCPDGLVCFLTGTTGTRCSCPGKNIGEGGADCVGIEDCAAGLLCQTINGDSTNRCMRLCRTNDQCQGKDGGAGGVCQISGAFGVCLF